MTTSEPHRICKNCLTGNVLPGTPKGTMNKITVEGGKEQEYYVAQGKGESDKLIILASDIFGFSIPNAKLMADIVAQKTGISVYVPDQFDGDFIQPGTLTFPEQPLKDKNIFGKVKAYWKLISSMIFYGGFGWMNKWRMEIAAPKMEKLTVALKAQTGAKRVGFVGYCYGGDIGIHLAPKHVLDVIVTLHPGNLKAEQFEEVNVPHCLILADEDISFDKIKDDSVKILERKKAEGLPIAIYSHEGTVHGSYARPLLSDPAIKVGWEEALEETNDWFRTHL